MEIKLKDLHITLDTYKRNILLICKEDKALKDMLDTLIYSWTHKGLLYREMDRDTKLIIENRIKYSDGKNQIPMLVKVSDMLDITWLIKVQEKAQVQMVYCSDEDIQLANFENKVCHDFDRFWNSNGVLFKPPILKEKGVILC